MSMDDHHSHEHHTHIGWAFFITAAYMIVEVVGGVWFNSLALLADAGHMFSDVIALGLAWIAIQIARRPAGDRHTFGFKRSEILAALVNGLAIWAIAALIFYEAIHRFYAPPQVQGKGMLLVATVGLIVNLALAALLFRDRDKSLNVKGAFLHVIADAIGSIGAIIAGITIVLTGWYLVDPIVSVLIGCLIIYSSLSLVKESSHILMQGVPAGIELGDIEQAIVEQDGVCCVYDLHVWSLTNEQHSLSAHVVLTEQARDQPDLIDRLRRMLSDRFHIDHSTIQLESNHDMRTEHERGLCRPGTECSMLSDNR